MTASAADSSVLRTLWRRPFLRRASLGLFIAGIGVGSTMPQMTLYLTRELGLSIELAGLYYLVNLMAPVAGFLVGSTSERLPDRLILVRICAVLGAIGWTVLALAHAPWVPFVIGALVLSFAGGAMGQLFAAVRDDLSREPAGASGSRVISAVRMCFTAGWIIGPVLGSWFGSVFGLRPLLLATAAIMLLELVPLGLLRVPRHVPPTPAVGTRDTPAATRPIGPLLAFLGCCLLVMNGDTMKFAYLPIYMVEDLQLDDLTRGAVISIQPLLELALMPLFARLAERTSAMRVVTLAALLGVGAHVAYATSTHVAGLFLGQILMSGVWAAMAGLGISIAQQLLPDRVGLASSLYGSALPLAGALGGAVGAFGVAALGVPEVFWIPAGLTVLGCIGLFWVGRRYRPDESVFLEVETHGRAESDAAS